MVNSTMINVLHITTHNEDCGIAKYQEQFVDAMKGLNINNEFFPYSPNVTKVMERGQFVGVLDDLKKSLRSYDILHIQHELSFFKHTELKDYINIAHDMGKKVAVTVHTAPRALYPQPEPRGGLGPRSFIAHYRSGKFANNYLATLVEPLKSVDLILVHNTNTKNDLVKFGLNESLIRIISMPVPKVTSAVDTGIIRDRLNAQKDDVIIGCVGFITPSKGVIDAVKALKFLPDNYKLAIIGGDHPSGMNTAYINEVTDKIIDLELRDRVYITGFIEDDRQLNNLVQEVDVCVYPYNSEYYKYASSAAVNVAISNAKPTITYPAPSFVELNKDEVIAICASSNYYELARFVKQADYPALSKKARQYAIDHSYPVEAEKLRLIYSNLLSSRRIA